MQRSTIRPAVSSDVGRRRVGGREAQLEAAQRRVAEDDRQRDLPHVADRAPHDAPAPPDRLARRTRRVQREALARAPRAGRLAQRVLDHEDAARLVGQQARAGLGVRVADEVLHGDAGDLVQRQRAGELGAQRLQARGVLGGPALDLLLAAPALLAPPRRRHVHGDHADRDERVAHHHGIEADLPPGLRPGSARWRPTSSPVTGSRVSSTRWNGRSTGSSSAGRTSPTPRPTCASAERLPEARGQRVVDPQVAQLRVHEGQAHRALTEDGVEHRDVRLAVAAQLRLRRPAAGRPSS